MNSRLREWSVVVLVPALSTLVGCGERSAPPAAATWTSTAEAFDVVGSDRKLTWEDHRFFLDGRPLSSFGLRAANALQNDEVADRLIEAMPTLKDHGIESIAVSLQGGRFTERGNSATNAFTPDGELLLEYAARLGRFLDASAHHGIAAVIMFFYRGRDQDLADARAVRRAVEVTTEFVTPWRHAWFHVINEWYHTGFDHPILTDTDGHRELYRLIKSIDPGRITHVSDADGAHDGIRSDTGRRETVGGVVVEYVRQDTYSEPGVFDRGESVYPGGARTMDEIVEDARVTWEQGGYWFWHAAWHQKADAPGWPRWDPGGEGTADDPGVAFIWRVLRRLSAG